MSSLIICDIKFVLHIFQALVFQCFLGFCVIYCLVMADCPHTIGVEFGTRLVCLLLLVYFVFKQYFCSELELMPLLNLPFIIL
jgi:hypothetical protein